MLTTTFAVCALLAQAEPPQEAAREPALGIEELRAAGHVAGLEFTPGELELMRRGVAEQLAGYQRLRDWELPNSTAPVLGFSRFVETCASRVPLAPRVSVARVLPDVARPANLEELCFADIPTLAGLIKSKRVSCVELTETYLARLTRIDADLKCVVTLLRDRALAQARRMDAELAQGRWRGMLHGLPWGAKDLLAVKGAPTTWGSAVFKDQWLDLDATVVQRLDQAGAILIAKLSLGELAWGDVWFGGTTKNPWDPSQGSSGSSAGPAAATAAGGVVFAIGSETCGSILSPSLRCGVSSIRPTYGLISRHGAMALAWSMDKLGPMARSMADASIVLAAVAGADKLDEECFAARYVDPGPQDVRQLKVGYVPGSFGDPQFEKEVLDALKLLDVELLDVALPELPSADLMTILTAEAATAFDELTRSGQDDLLVRQVEQAWPNVFRQGRTIPAVEYLRANRVRRDVALVYTDFFASLDALVHPTTQSELLIALNLTGHPSVCVPAGFGAARSADAPRGALRGVAFSGQLFAEARLVALAEAWQEATAFHLEHPPR